MIDAADVLRDYLLTNTAITTLVGTRIWAPMTYPPDGYKPSQGAALVFKTRGGAPDYTQAHMLLSWQIKSYGATLLVASALDRAVADALFDARWGDILESSMEQAGQSIPEPDTDWPCILSFYATRMRSGLPIPVPA